MRKAIMAAMVLLTVSLLIAQTPAPELSAFPPSKAKVYIDALGFEYGYMPNDASVSHSYWLHSRGEDSLKILRVKPACGCTKAPLKKEVIAVGDSGEVELVFRASPGQKGKANKTATVTCNDNDKGNFQLSFGANIYAKEFPDSLTPLALSVGSAKWDQASKENTQSIIMKNVSTAPISISVIAKPDGYVDLNMPSGDIKPGKSIDLKFKIAKSFTGQEFTKSFTIACNDAGNTRYSIPVVMTASVTAVAPPLQKPADTKTVGTEHSGGSK